MSSSERHKARELVRKFAAKSAGGVFAHLKRSDIAVGLLKRLDDPGLICQGTSSLCGPAALLFNYASQRPAEYVRFVTLLYELGAASLGNLTAKPGSDLRNYGATSASKKIGNRTVLIDPEPVDWIALASIRDSENWFFDYQSVKDKVAGITMPGTLEDWFKKAGFKKVRNVTNVYFTKDEATAKRAVRSGEKKGTMWHSSLTRICSTRTRRPSPPPFPTIGSC